MKKILVIGADTLPGRGIAIYLHEQGYEIQGVAQERNPSLPFPFFVYQSLNEVSVQEKFDCIVLAANYLSFPESINPLTDWLEEMEKNTERMIAYLRPVGKQWHRVIHLSTTLVYMEGRKEREKLPEYGTNPYGVLKRREEELLGELHGIEKISLRIPEVVAEDATEGWLADVIQKTQKNEDVTAGALDSIPNLIWLEDLAYFVEKLIKKSKWQYDTVHLVSHRKRTVREILKDIIKFSDSKSFVVVDGRLHYQSPLLDDNRALEMGFTSISYYEMTRRMIPDSLAGIMKEAIAFQNDFLSIPSEDNIPVSRYEERYLALKQKYKKFFLYSFECWGISYMCYTLYLFMFERKFKENGLHIFLPRTTHTSISPNWWLYRYCEKKMGIMPIEDIEFWQYVMKCHPQDICVDVAYNYDKMIERGLNYRYRPFSKNFIIEFSAKDEMEAFRQMQLMGLDGKEYICFYARDNSWARKFKIKLIDDKSQIDPDAEFNDRCRNSNVENYRLALQRIAKKGYFSVRMGAVAEQPFEGDNIVDYATKHRTEMMDFYLLAHCRYFICTSSGIFSIAMLFRTPMVFVNVAVMTQSMDNLPPLTPERDLMIPMKFWNTREGRYLSLREQLAFERDYGEISIFRKYADYGIEIHENTPEEIADAVMEMEERLDGVRIYTKEDNELQERYRDILMEFMEQSSYNWLDARLGTEFLKKNPWFLE